MTTMSPEASGVTALPIPSRPELEALERRIHKGSVDLVDELNAQLEEHLDASRPGIVIDDAAIGRLYRFHSWLEIDLAELERAIHRGSAQLISDLNSQLSALADLTFDGEASPPAGVVIDDAAIGRLCRFQIDLEIVAEEFSSGIARLWELTARLHHNGDCLDYAAAGSEVAA